MIKVHKSEPIISIVMPCLNEASAIGWCIDQAKAFLNHIHQIGEIIIVDNGSVDGSYEIAVSKNVIVVREDMQGYGVALLTGLSAARGKYILVIDADGTYDIFDAIPMLDLLRNGNKLVIGSRLRGEIETHAMPWLHRYIGTPILTWLIRLLTNYQISDSQSGFRALEADFLKQIRLFSPGMEFASEMLLTSALAGLKISEHPVSYHKRRGKSKLSAVRDGVRHLRLIISLLPLVIATYGQSSQH